MMTEIIHGTFKRSRRLRPAGALFLFLFVLMPPISFASAEARIEGKKNVLILNSYHEGFKWTDDITRGVIAALEPVRGETRIFIEYLDTKWVKDELYFQQLRQILKHKYARTRFDLIVSSDNDAFDFLREYRNEVFGKVPVVFNGVNYFKQSNLAGTTLFTGVSETADLRESIDLALRLHPSAKRIFVINDNAVSGRKVKDELEKLAPNFQGRAWFEYENSADLEKILKDVESLAPDTLIFYTFFYGDPTRASYENSECISLISRYARVPVYGAWDFNLGYGIVGGKLTSGYYQGITSGRMGLRILKGERVEDIPPLLKSRSRYMFDYRQMARFGIKKSALPEGSVIINEPKTFQQVPTVMIWAALLGIASLSAVILMLLYVNRQRKRSEEALRKSHDGLEKRVEERTAELAKATEALITAEQEKSLFLNVTDALVLYHDTEMNIHWANRAACESVKMTQDELLQRRCWEIWHQRREPCAGCPVILSRDTGEPQEAEMCSPDGRVWFIRGYPVKDKAGRLTGMFEFCQDFTERKRAEEELRKSEIEQRKLARELAQKNNFLRTLIDAMPDLIFYKDCNRIYIGCNRAFEAFAGRPEKDMVGLGDLDIFSRDVADAFREMDLAVLSTEESLRNEEWIDYPDGRRVLLETLKTPFFDLEGEILGVVGVSRDITERKRAEEALKLSKEEWERTFTSVPDLIAILDDRHRIIRVNEAMAKCLGLAPDECAGLYCYEAIHGLSEPPPNCPHMQTLKDGRKHVAEVHEERLGGDFLVSCTPLNDARGEMIGSVHIAYDITERKRAEEALRESESRVRRKLESILDPEGDMGELDLVDILDAPQIQALMEDLYRVTGFRMSIIDLKGRVLVDVGWQPICAKFHRTHPESLRRCRESDTELTVGIPPGEFRTYRCRNNMWHIVTPIIVGGRHLANLFMGQFFFVDERIDYELFRSQARTCGFPEEDYIAALEAVPRYSEELVDRVKAVFLRLTDMFSRLSYANIKLAHSVAERDRLTETLREANLVVENSPAVLFRWGGDDEWPVVLVSGNVIQFGYTPDDFLSGSISYSVIIHPDDLDRVTREVHEFGDRGDDQIRLEYRIMTKAGEIRWVNELTNIERDAAGDVCNFEGIVIDVTDRKLFEEELQCQKTLLQELNDTLEKRVTEEVTKNREKDIMLIQQSRQAALGEMLDHIAHQWKQPLNSISIIVQDMEETASYGELTNEFVEETAGKIIALVDHMAQTLGVFRGFYRPDKEKKVFNIKDAIDQALAFIAPAFRFHSIAVELDVDPGVTAFGYPKEYAQVLLNILANARDVFKARRTEKPRVIIRAFEDGKKAVVTVTDNGGGIPEAIMDRIFDFYFTTNEAGGGTGIGLYMSRNIIEKNMGGTLSVENTDEGARFRIEVSPT